MNYNKIKVELEKRKITIKEFCRRIDLTEQGLHQMIRNESMKVDLLERMSNVLNVPISFWFDVETEDGTESKKQASQKKEAHDIYHKIDSITVELNKVLKEIARS